MTALPELCHDHGCYCGAHESECVFRLREALAIAWEALGQMSSWPNQNIAEIAMHRIEELGKE